MTNLVINGLDDQTIFLVWEQVSKLLNFTELLNWPAYKNLFYYFIHPLSSNEPLTMLFLSKFLEIPLIGTFNMFLLITVLLNLGFSYLYFKRYKFSFFYVLIFCFSSYFLSHLAVHVSLMQIWVIPLAFLYFEKNDLSSNIKSAFFISVAVLTSNYLGMFVLMGYGLYFLITSFTNVKEALIALRTVFIAIVITSVILFPYIKLNYFSESQSTVLYTRPNRNIDDYIRFSSRPWYFFIPPVKNPIFGTISLDILEKIKSTKHFLTNEYFAGEHQADYFGLTLLFTYVFCVTKSFRNFTFLNKQKIIQRLVLLGLLIIFMMPPFFTFKGTILYTPSIWFFQLFSMFRVTARLSILVLFLMLDSLAGILDLSLTKNFKNYALMACLTLITLIEVYVPVKLVQLPSSIPAYEYLSTFSAGTTFAVYPYNRTDDALYYLPIHKQFLVNPRGYFFDGFDSEKFTKNLLTEKNKVDLLLVGQDTTFVPNANMILERAFDSYNVYRIKND